MRDPARCPVWMYEAVPEIPASRALPVEELVRKYGSFFFTSSLAWMIACAIEDILEERAKNKANDLKQPEEDEIGMWGVDMAANEEYGYQRAGCQHFLLIAADLGIKITVPPESDLLRPMPLYGINESSHWMIKFTIRKQEHQQRIAASQQQIAVAMRNQAFMEGALDELTYQMQTWGEDRVGIGVDPEIIAQMPRVRAAALRRHIQEHPPSIPPDAQASLGSSNTYDSQMFGLARVKAPPKKAKRKR